MWSCCLIMYLYMPPKLILQIFDITAREVCPGKGGGNGGGPGGGEGGGIGWAVGGVALGLVLIFV